MPPKTVLVVGGTEAQGIPVVKSMTFHFPHQNLNANLYLIALISNQKYTVRVLTRDNESLNAKEPASLPNVTIMHGPSYNEASLYKAFDRVELAFINTNGFAI